MTLFIMCTHMVPLFTSSPDRVVGELARPLTSGDDRSLAQIRVGGNQAAIKEAMAARRNSYIPYIRLRVECTFFAPLKFYACQRSSLLHRVAGRLVIAIVRWTQSRGHNGHCHKGCQKANKSFKYFDLHSVKTRFPFVVQ